jgi:hypothetical protein
VCLSLCLIHIPFQESTYIKTWDRAFKNVIAYECPWFPRS